MVEIVLGWLDEVAAYPLLKPTSCWSVGEVRGSCPSDARHAHVSKQSYQRSINYLTVVA